MGDGVVAVQLGILCASAVLCGLVVLLFTRGVLRLGPNKESDLALVVINGMRAFFLGTPMLALVGIATFQGSDAFYVYDDGGGHTLTFGLRIFSTDCLIGGLILIPLDWVYLGIARHHGRRGLLRIGFLLSAPFAFLVAVFFADIGMFVPMI